MEALARCLETSASCRVDHELAALLHKPEAVSKMEQDKACTLCKPRADTASLETGYCFAGDVYLGL